MDIKQWQSAVLSEPLKWVAILITIVSAGFFVSTILPVLKQETQSEEKSAVTIQSETQEEITAKSPLFVKPLFGEYIPEASEENIKQSSLDVVLVGIMYAGKDKHSQVLIKSADGEEHIYGIGDKLPGGAVIKRIDKQGVIVLYNGALESLALPKDELNFEAPEKPLFGD